MEQGSGDDEDEGAPAFLQLGPLLGRDTEHGSRRAEYDLDHGTTWWPRGAGMAMI